MIKDYEIIPHTADLKLRVYGADLPMLFKNALIGMFQALKPIASSCEYHDDRLVCNTLPILRDMQVKSPDQEALLVDFLSQALYLSDVYNEAYFEVHFTTLEPTQLMGTLKGVSITGMQESEIKAVTYHDLAITQHEGIWQTDIVFDI